MSIQYLQRPPLKSDVAEANKLSTDYQKYLTNVNATVQGAIKPMTYTKGTTAALGHVFQVPPYKTTEINSIQNPVDGAIVYDTDVNDFKFRVAGAWVVK